MKKNNFFNFKEKNGWDIGWPCSPRVYCLCVVIIISIILSISFTSCNNIPIISDNNSQFVVSKIEEMHDGNSKYTSDSDNSGYGINATASIILPSRMFNIGDTIKATNFISSTDSITKK